jgi:Ca2+-dependent lipid-binding protein
LAKEEKEKGATKKSKKATIKSTQSSSQPRGAVEFEGILTIKLRRGLDLKACDVTGKSDPYVYFASGPDKNDVSNLYPGQIVKSEIVEQTLNPVWDQSLMVCVATTKSDILHLEVWDWDRISEDDFVSFSFYLIARWATII